MHVVARKYGVARGGVQSLSQSSDGFAAGMVRFCQHLGWGALAAALDHFADRLRAGASADLLALAQVSFVKSRTARVFWENGLRTVAAVANADPRDVVPVLMQAQPNKLRAGRQDPDEARRTEEKLFARAQVIVNSANKLWREWTAPDACLDRG